MQQKVITIFGTSRAKAGDVVYDEAVELGRQLGRAGFAIANGGYGGTMQAAASGAAEAGGVVYGITCNAFKKARANEFVSQEIKTDSLQARLNKLIEIGDAYVVLQGGTGTLLELAEVWELKNKKFMKADKPIILLGSFWQPLVELMAIDDVKSSNCLIIAQTVDEAVRIIVEKFGE